MFGYHLCYRRTGPCRHEIHQPVVAAVLNVVGSLFVVFNSARLVRQGEEFDPHLAAAKPAQNP